MTGCSATARHLRKAHAAEIFRSAYGRSQGLSSISVQDLDELVSSRKIRPSLVVGVAEVSGHLLGGLSKLLPSQVSGFVTSAIDEAVKVQFNDSIRDLSTEVSEDGELKETLKYHRDFQVQETRPEHADSRYHQADIGALSQLLVLAERL